MINTALIHVVERLADIAYHISDADLDREWAWGAYDSEGVRFALFRTYEELRETAARTATQRVSREQAPSTAQRILAQYHAAYRDLQAALLGLGDAEANLAPAVGEWAVRQIVAHAVGADVGFYGVVRYALDRHRSADGRPAEIPSEAWAPMIGMDDAAFESLMNSPLAQLESYHASLHDRILQAFSDISEDELALPSMYWEGYELSLRFRLHRFDSHLRQHIVQVDKTLPAIGYPPSEAKRLLRLIFAALAEAEGATLGAWESGTETWRDVAETISARVDEIAAVLD